MYAMPRHVRFYLESLRDFLGPDVPLRVKIINLTPDSSDDAAFGTPIENLRREFRDVTIGLEKAQTRRTGYYRELRFKVYASPAGEQEIELVDGGGTDWTQKLLNNAKERLVTSGIGSERLCERFVPVRQSLSSRTRKSVRT
jgi:hypothetical protein